MHIIFFGSPREAARSLETLLSVGHDVVGVYTRPDRSAGRGLAKSPTPVKLFAEQQGLPVFTPRILDPAIELDRMVAANADVFVVVAYGRILPAELLAVPPMGVVNVHPSLLPAFGGAGWYGRRVHQGVLDAGCRVSGVRASDRPTIFSMG